MIGTALHPRRPAHDLDTVDPGKAQVEEDHIGLLVRGQVEPLLAAAGHDHLVAPGRRLMRQGPQQRDVVIDDQHPCALVHLGARLGSGRPGRARCHCGSCRPIDVRSGGSGPG